jgi:hypothetical protein
MKKYILLLLLINISWAQKASDWSNVNTNFPISKDDTSSIVYADSGETIKALYINKILRAIRELQDKVGIGNSLPSIPDQILKVQNDGSTLYETISEFDSAKFQAEWRNDISDSIAGIGAQSLNYRCWTVVAKSGGKYSTIQSAINSFGTMKTDSQAVVEIMPGIYNESITMKNYINLHFYPGAKLKYTTAGTLSAVNITSADTVWIYGGQFGRYVTSGYAGGIFNLDNRSKLNLYNAVLYLQQANSANSAYHFLADSSQIEAYNTELLTIGDHVGGIHLTGNSQMDINGNYFCGSLFLENSSQLIMTYNYSWMDTDKSYYQMKNTSYLNISVKRQWLKTTNGIASESAYWGPGLYIYNKSKFVVHDGIYNFMTYVTTSDSTNIEILNCYNYTGRPNITTVNGSVNDTTYWKIRNSNLIMAPILSTDLALGGIHFFESNPTSGDTDYVNLQIENSTLIFGEKNGLGVGDTAQYVGNIFQMGWRGLTRLINSTFVDYGDDGRGAAYTYFGNIMGIIKFEAIGCTFEHWSKLKDGFMISLYSARAPLNIIFQDCKFYYHNNAPRSAFYFNNNGSGLREICSKDTININGINIFSPLGSSSLWRHSGAGVLTGTLDSLAKAKGWISQNGYFSDLEVLNQFKGPGPGSTLNNHTGLTTFSDGYVMVGTDTIAKPGQNGDSLKIRLTPNWLMQNVYGYYRAHKSDINMTIYVTYWNFSSYAYTAAYDIRLTQLWNANNSNYGYFFHADTLKAYGIGVKFTWGGMDSSGGYSYMLPYFYLINSATASAIAVQIWVKQSLNYSKLECVRF